MRRKVEEEFLGLFFGGSREKVKEFQKMGSVKLK